MSWGVSRTSGPSLYQGRQQQALGGSVYQGWWLQLPKVTQPRLVGSRATLVLIVKVVTIQMMVKLNGISIGNQAHKVFNRFTSRAKKNQQSNTHSPIHFGAIPISLGIRVTSDVAVFNVFYDHFLQRNHPLRLHMALCLTMMGRQF